jgi:hypothetical protein
MALDNLRCPQFVDFTNTATFDIDDGADVYFGKIISYYVHYINLII